MTQVGKHTRTHGKWMLVLLVSLTTLSCMPGTPILPALLNNTASLGGDTVGGRANLQVAVINNTPWRAIFTIGTYDPLYQPFAPRFRQFWNDPTTATNRLDAFTQSDTVTFNQCGRAVGVGNEELIDHILKNDTSAQQVTESSALRPLTNSVTGDPMAGVLFVDETDATLAPRAWSRGIRTLQGSEYLCGSLLIYTFEPDESQPGGVRIDLQVVQP